MGRIVIFIAPSANVVSACFACGTLERDRPPKHSWRPVAPAGLQDPVPAAWGTVSYQHAKPRPRMLFGPLKLGAVHSVERRAETIQPDADRNMFAVGQRAATQCWLGEQPSAERARPGSVRRRPRTRPCCIRKPAISGSSSGSSDDQVLPLAANKRKVHHHRELFCRPRVFEHDRQDEASASVMVTARHAAAGRAAGQGCCAGAGVPLRDWGTLQRPRAR